MMFDITHIDSAVIARFASLGATRAACFELPVRRYGILRYEPFTDLIYFFDAQNREIGYWSVLTPFNYNEPHVFAPNYRNWDASFLEKLVTRSLPEVSDGHQAHERPDAKSEVGA